MLYNCRFQRSLSSITPCVEEKISRTTEGLPAKRVVVKRDLVCTNSKAFRSTLADVNDDQLEIDLATGVRLERVASQILAPDRIDFSKGDVKEIKKDDKATAETVDFKTVTNTKK